MNTYANKAEWLRDNPEIGELVGGGIGKFYKVDSDGHAIKCHPPVFTDDQPETSVEREYTKVEPSDFGWRVWNDSMNYRESKVHLTFDRGETALCGVRVPAEGDGVEFSGDYGYGDCKRCQNKSK